MIAVRGATNIVDIYDGEKQNVLFVHFEQMKTQVQGFIHISKHDFKDVKTVQQRQGILTGFLNIRACKSYINPNVNKYTLIVFKI